MNIEQLRKIPVWVHFGIEKAEVLLSPEATQANDGKAINIEVVTANLIQYHENYEEVAAQGTEDDYEDYFNRLSSIIEDVKILQDTNKYPSSIKNLEDSFTASAQIAFSEGYINSEQFYSDTNARYRISGDFYNPRPDHGVIKLIPNKDYKPNGSYVV